jgi:uncharacterized protein YecT (DUF1311 family)
MRIIWLMLVAIPFGFAGAALAQDSSDPDHSLSEKLPLFTANHCNKQSALASQLFCGEPRLNAAGTRLSEAVQDRLSRLADRRMAIEENAAWIKERNLSCGIFGNDPVHFDDIEPIIACLLKETEERTAILRDPNFDCLAANTSAGALICSDPLLAEGEAELNAQALALIGKLKEDETREAFAEFARWIRERDRKCKLDGKDNVPLTELSSSEGCLADFIRGKTAEIAAAHGDPKRAFGRRIASPLPNADAVDLCVSQIHATSTCDDFLRIRRVFEIDSEVSEQNALVTAEVEMVVLEPFAVCSPIASSCTGACWDPKTGKPTKPAPGSRDSFTVSHRVTIEKAFAFQKADNGTWRCNATALPPVDFGVALSGP